MTEQKKTRQKRVSFPYISIKDAITYIEKLKAYKGFGQIGIRDALLKIGYTPTSSSADRALSAMVKSYGLLGQEGSKDSDGHVWLTSLAKKIVLNPQDSEERKSAISQAVLSDELMAKVVNKWSDGIPARNDIIRELQLDQRFDFTESAAIRFATVIQETFDALDVSMYNGTDVQDDFEKPGDNILPQNLERTEIIPTSVSDYALPLAGGKKKVILRAPSGLTTRDFDRIIQWINLMKDGLLDDEQIETNE